MSGAILRYGADLPELVPSAETLRVLREAERDSHLAQDLAVIENELSDRLRSDVQDEPAVGSGREDREALPVLSVWRVATAQLWGRAG
jgi:hypothetical protein